MNLDGLELPTSVESLVELYPFEDIALAILRRALPGVAINSRIPPSGEIVFPFILVTRRAPLENWRGDPRFTDVGRIAVGVFTEDPEGFEKAQYISEAVRVALRTAWLEHWSFPDMGSVVRIELRQEPTRSPDWATSAGPVQFADLPGNIHRLEAEYRMQVRRPRQY